MVTPPPPTGPRTVILAPPPVPGVDPWDWHRARGEYISDISAIEMFGRKYIPGSSAKEIVSSGYFKIAILTAIATSVIAISVILFKRHNIF